MNKENENIDRSVRNKLRDFSKPPPPDVWEGIASGVNSIKRKKTAVFYWKIAAGIAIILSLGGAFLYVSLDNNILKRSTENITNNIEYKNDKRVNKDSGKRAVTPFETQNEEEKDGMSRRIETNNENPTVKIAAKTEKTFQNSLKESKPIQESIPNEPSSTPKGLISALKEITAQPEPANIRNDRIPFPEFHTIANLDQHKAQESTYDQNSQKKFSVSAFGSPLYSYREIAKTDQFTSTYLNNSENGKFTYSGGFQVGYKTSKRLSIYTGITYSKMGLAVNNVDLYTTARTEMNTDLANPTENSSDLIVINNSIGTIAGSEQNNTSYLNSSTGQSAGEKYEDYGSHLVPTDVSSQLLTRSTMDQFLHIMEIPLMFRYKLIDKKIGLSLRGGLSTSIIMDSEQTLFIGENTIDLGPAERIRKMNYSSKIGFGIHYDISDLFVLNMEPGFTYFLHSINQENLIISRPFSFGLYTGLQYKF